MALCEVAPVGLLHHDAGESTPFARAGAPVLGEGLGHQSEHARDGGQVVQTVPAGAVDLVGFVQMLLQPVEGVGMVVLAGDVLEPLGQGPPRRSALGGGLGHVGSELLVVPGGPGHPDEREPVLQHSPVGQAGQRGEDLPGGQVAGRAEDDQRHRRGGGEHRRERTAPAVGSGRRPPRRTWRSPTRCSSRRERLAALLASGGDEGVAPELVAQRRDQAQPEGVGVA